MLTNFGIVFRILCSVEIESLWLLSKATIFSPYPEIRHPKIQHVSDETK